ncbi:hypothetical protein GFL39_17435 [Rhizobium leguminosarum bv. viciae]|nr:hypothetical protein [Rhizobium leguminosarum bv. viciae]NKL06685.1 hypothetical protein [Rhizobium leguminosarum bv. viciae]NKL84365.1 hypothetical protein [Rhizobium leguminosarum bv. viciae]NKL92902.1 hypothetical protein [Rhizobium leguminosarum bv. viciae]NKM92947.1 hypothetical protein [Rhizobium leguminosarum bv. viciae]
MTVSLENCRPLEHDAEKCERFSGDIMLSLYNVEQDSDFRPTRPKSSCPSASCVLSDAQRTL